MMAAPLTAKMLHSLMRFCATYLHQVQGTLRMVELYGAAMVVEEMERVAHALLDNQVKQKDEAYGVLMRGIVQLPDDLVPALARV